MSRASHSRIPTLHRQVFSLPPLPAMRTTASTTEGVRSLNMFGMTEVQFAPVFVIPAAGEAIFSGEYARFSPPQVRFGSPQATFASPNIGSAPPNIIRGAAQATFASPNPKFGSPRVKFSPPNAGHGSPQVQFSAPNIGCGNPPAIRSYFYKRAGSSFDNAVKPTQRRNRV